MIVNFEFLGEEPLDNVVTCLDYHMDKVVYFCYEEQKAAQKGCITNFLQKYCGVQEIRFCTVSQNNLDDIIRVMRQEIERELEEQSDIYFDITGGESLVLVAFGMLAKDYDTPMHVYNIPKNEYLEFECGSTRKLSECVAKQSIKLTIEKCIELRGGVINYQLHKDVKRIKTPEFNHDVSKIWHVSKKYMSYWNPFSDFLRKYLVPDMDLIAMQKTSVIEKALTSSKNRLKSKDKFNEILDALEKAQVLEVLKRDENEYRIKFKNEAIKACLWEGGSVLELHTFQMFRCRGEDCEIGLHLDWDGIIHPDSTSEDVDNEIDVIQLENRVLKFISCKSGSVNKKDLYELETVTRRFGGKYAKMVFVTLQPMAVVDSLRAQEMGIEILNVGQK